MKNKAIQLAIAHQYQIDPEKVKVEFLASIGHEYEFAVTVYLNETCHEEFTVKISTSEIKTTSYNEESKS